MRTTIRLSIIFGFLATLGLAGCGVKGPLEPPGKSSSLKLTQSSFS